MVDRSFPLPERALNPGYDEGSAVKVFEDIRDDIDAVRAQMEAMNTDLAALEAVSSGQLTGWADYVDTQYTSMSPFELDADTDTLLPNNAGTIRETEKPSDVTTFYDSENGLITGREGDAIILTLDMIVVPGGNNGYIENWIDIGEPVGELYRRINTFPRGISVARQIVTTTYAYTLDTWETNGGQVYVRSNVACDIYNIRYVIGRGHKAFGSYS